ncbi:MAG: anti-sigma factor family protein [Planctomycetota bacterium]|jgi:anti-sigma factor RsiW
MPRPDAPYHHREQTIMTSPDPADPRPDGLERRLATSIPARAVDCPDALTLASYLDGRAGPAERQSVESHLAACPECLLAVREARSIAGADPSSIEVPPGVLAAARALVDHDAASAGDAMRRRLVFPDWRAAARWSVAAAAMLIICLLGYQAGLSSLPESERTVPVATEDLSFGVFNAGLNDDLTRDVFIVTMSEVTQ